MKANQKELQKVFDWIDRLPRPYRWITIAHLIVLPRMPLWVIKTYMLLASYLFGRANGRCVRLQGLAWRAFRKGKYDQAQALAQEWLTLAERIKDYRRGLPINYGETVHDGHQIIGLICLRSGNVEEAGQHLLAAGHTPGSPGLNSYGPTLELAQELLLHGQKEVVIQYLELVAGFWASGKPWRSRQFTFKRERLIKQWISTIHGGRIPKDEQWQWRNP